MGVSLSVKAFSSVENKEFQKHYSVVEFCIKNELSFPKETSEFFKGKINGDDLEDYNREYILENIKDGVPQDLIIHSDEYGYTKTIYVSEIPKEVDKIIISLC